MVSHWLDRYSLYIALAAAWIATLGSLYFSEVAGYVPCEFCWYQRILMYPLAVILVVGILRRDRSLPFYILPFSIAGIGMSTYHYLIQKTDIFGATSCEVGVPCTTMWINWFGFMTIPFLALTAFVIITIMTLIAMNTEVSVLDVAEATPWMPVSGLVGGLLVFFVLLGLIGIQQQVATSLPAPSGALAMSGEHGEMAIDGAVIYRQACGACHGADMEGVPGLGNALRESAFVAERTDEELLTFVREGRAANDPVNSTGVMMPPSGGQPDLSDEEILAAIREIRRIQGNGE